MQSTDVTETVCRGESHQGGAKDGSRRLQTVTGGRKAEAQVMEGVHHDCQGEPRASQVTLTREHGCLRLGG